MNRGQFLKAALLGFLPLAMKPSALFATPGISHAHWLQILQHALMCPSVHNIQPWKVRINSEDSATVFFDSDKQIPYSDKNGAFMAITMSMFVETVIKVAAVQGFRAVATYEPYIKLPVNEGFVAFAEIKLVKAEAHNCLDVSALYTRRTARFGYHDKAIDQTILTELAATAGKKQHLFSYTTDEEQIFGLKHLAMGALLEDLDDDRYRNELKPWIRTGGEDQQMRDGLSAACFGQPDGMTRRFFDHHERFHARYKKMFLRAHYWHSLNHTRTIFWLSGNFSTYHHWLQCGRSLLEVWLQLAAFNLYIQPFGNLITNEKAHPILKQSLNTCEEPWFIARVGYCDMPPPSVRKSLQTILIT